MCSSDLYLSANPNASNADKKAKLREISENVIDKYEGEAIKKFQIYDQKNNRINYHFIMNDLNDLRKDYIKNPSNEHPLAKYAVKFGYKDSKGNPDINSFLEDTLPNLEKQLNR